MTPSLIQQLSLEKYQSVYLLDISSTMDTCWKAVCEVRIPHYVFMAQENVILRI